MRVILGGLILILFTVQVDAVFGFPTNGLTLPMRWCAKCSDHAIFTLARFLKNDIVDFTPDPELIGHPCNEKKYFKVFCYHSCVNVSVLYTDWQLGMTIEANYFDCGSYRVQAIDGKEKYGDIRHKSPRGDKEYNRTFRDEKGKNVYVSVNYIAGPYSESEWSDNIEALYAHRRHVIETEAKNKEVEDEKTFIIQISVSGVIIVVLAVIACVYCCKPLKKIPLSKKDVDLAVRMSELQAYLNN